MKKNSTWIMRALPAALLLTIAALPGAPAQAQDQAPNQTAAPAMAAAGGDPQVLRGAYLAQVGDCAACHTAAKGKPFAGGLPLGTPFGTVFSTNITPDQTTGIGSYTYDDFAKALRQGVAKDGHHLYPAMPYPSYAKIDDADMHALYGYFEHGVKPVAQTNQANALRFPFNIRMLMIGWNWLYAPKPGYQADPHQSVEWNRGAYLVEGLGHCSACHTPHGMFGQEAAFDSNGNDVFLSGYTFDGWYAPSLRGHPAGGALWSKQELAAYLRSGRMHDGAAFGPMTEVVNNSTQYLHDDDLQAIATYLTTPPLQPAGVRTVAANSGDGSQDATAAALRLGHIGSNGAALYLNNCNACHRSDGTGAMPTFPKLGGNASVTSTDPTSLIRIVLSGARMPSTTAAPTPLAMPDFGWRLGDQQVADLLTFVRGSWGNHAPAVTAQQVAAVRKVAQSTR